MPTIISWDMSGGLGASFAIVTLKATALLLVALATSLLARRAAAETRHLIWMVTLAGLLVLPVLAVWAPLQVAILPAATPVATQQINNETPLAPTQGVVELTDAQRGTPPPEAPAQTNISQQLAWPTSAANALLLAWLLVAGILLVWLAQGQFAVRRIVRRAQRLDSPEWQAPLYEIADRMKLEAAPELLRSSDVHMPFACGVRRSIVVLPAESDSWSEAQRQAVLIHELGHVQRRDLVGHTIGHICCALYWFHPMVWRAARQLRDESERACDDLALTFGTVPSSYAEHLLDLVTRVRNHKTPSIALAMAHRREFEGRMLAILDPQLQRSSASKSQRVSLVGGLALFALVVSAAAPVQRSAGLPAQAPAPVSRPLPTPVTTSPAAPPNAPTTPAAPQSSPVAPTVDEDANLANLNRNISHIVNSYTAQISSGLAARDAMRAVLQKVSVPVGEDPTAALVKVLRSDNSPEVRRIAAWGLMEYTMNSIATQALGDALAKDTASTVRSMAAWALGEGGEVTAIPHLLRAFRLDKVASIREVAVWGLGELAATDAADAIGGQLANEPSALVRGTAAWALGNLNVKQAPKGLLLAAADSNADVRLKAAWALSEIEDPAALPTLRKAIAKESSSAALRAQLRALITCGEKSEGLTAMISSEHPEVRAMAVRALAGDGFVSPWPWPWPRPMPFP